MKSNIRRTGLVVIVCVLIMRLDRIVLALTSMYLAIKKANHDNSRS